MPTVAIDRASTQSDVIITSFESDVEGQHEGCTITIVIPADQQAAWLAAYDPSNQYSPSAGDSRVIGRAVLDELKRVTGG